MPLTPEKQVPGARRGVDVEAVAVLRVGIILGIEIGLDAVDDVTGHVRHDLVAVVGGGLIRGRRAEVARAKGVQHAVVRARVDHVGARLVAGSRCEARKGLSRVLRHRIAAGVELVGPNIGIRGFRRPHPGGARIDDVAEHAGAGAERADRGRARGRCLLIAAIAAQVVEARIVERRRRGIDRISPVELGLLRRSQAGPLEGDARRAVPRQDHAIRGRFGRDRSGGTGGVAHLPDREPGEHARAVPVDHRADHEIVRIGVAHRLTDILRGQRAGQGGRIVVGEIRLRAGLNLGGLLLVEAAGALRRGRRGRLETHDLVDVSAAAGGAGKSEAHIRRYLQSAALGDVLIGDHILQRAAVVAVRKTQQSGGRDPQVVDDGNRLRSHRRGLVGQLAGGGQNLECTGNGGVIGYRDARLHRRRRIAEVPDVAGSARELNRGRALGIGERRRIVARVERAQRAPGRAARAAQADAHGDVVISRRGIVALIQEVSVLVDAEPDEAALQSVISARNAAGPQVAVEIHIRAGVAQAAAERADIGGNAGVLQEEAHAVGPVAGAAAGVAFVSDRGEGHLQTGGAGTREREGEIREDGAGLREPVGEAQSTSAGGGIGQRAGVAAEFRERRAVVVRQAHAGRIAPPTWSPPCPRSGRRR